MMGFEGRYLARYAIHSCDSFTGGMPEVHVVRVVVVVLIDSASKCRRGGDIQITKTDVPPSGRYTGLGRAPGLNRE
jgi:hypothetical protein